MIQITRFFYIHFLVLLLLVVAFLTGTQMTFFISFCIVLMHELSHLLAALLCNVRVHSILVMPFGMTIRLDSSLIKKPKKEVLIALAGPLANGVMLLCGLSFFRDGVPTFYEGLYMVLNGAMLLLNLIPVPPLDGGRILRAFVIAKSGFITAAKYMRKVSYGFIALLFAAGFALLVLFRGNPSLVMAAAFLLYHLADEKKHNEFLWMRELIYEKERQKDQQLIATKILTVRQNTPAKTVLKKLNFSTFYLIAVVDDRLQMTATVTESDVIRSIMQKGYGISIGEVS